MEIGTPKHIWQLTFEGEWPTSVTFLGGNRRIAAGNRAGEIYIWELPESPPNESKEIADHDPYLRLDGHENGITHLIAKDNGGTLISSSLDRTVRIWDLTAAPTGNADAVLDQHQRETASRRKSDEEKKKILEAPGIQVKTLSSQYTLEGHTDWIKALAISADERRLISGDDACQSIVWDLVSRKPVAKWTGYHRVWVSSVALNPDGSTAFVGEFAGRRSSFDVPAAQARLWDVRTGEIQLDLLKTWTPQTKDKDRVDSYGYGQTWRKIIKRGLVCAAVSPDGKLLAVGQGGETDKGQVHLVNMKSGKIERTVSGHRYGACDVKFSADGNYILSSGRDTTVRICQVSDGKEVATLGKERGGQFKDWLHAISISADQRYVSAADIAGKVHVWDLKGE